MFPVQVNIFWATLCHEYFVLPWYVLRGADGHSGKACSHISNDMEFIWGLSNVRQA